MVVQWLDCSTLLVYKGYKVSMCLKLFPQAFSTVEE